VADFTEAQDDLRKRTSGALAYPVFLGVVGTLVVVVLMVFFVPKFDSLFENLRDRGELPIVTDLLLTTSELMWSYGPHALVATLVAGFFLARWLKTDQGRLAMDRFRIKLPIVGKVFLSLAVARFCRVLGTLLHNGVPIVRSLEISSDATGNRVLGLAIQEASENISAGESLAGPLGSSGHFPPMVVEMVAVAEESNTLENVLLDVADSLERRTWRQLDIAVRLIEPIMLLALASVVLVLVIALLLPVLKMSTTI
jgi:type II secretory pathway component PulF